jgi:hypothetical protein
LFSKRKFFRNNHAAQSGEECSAEGPGESRPTRQCGVEKKTTQESPKATTDCFKTPAICDVLRDIKGWNFEDRTAYSYKIDTLQPSQTHFMLQTYESFK